MSVKPEELEDFWLYKYVTFDDGNVLFCDGCSIFDSHKQLVNEVEESNPAVKPVSAGKVKIRDRKWALVEGGSTTANLPRGENDEDLVGKVLEKHGFTYDIEISYW